MKNATETLVKLMRENEGCRKYIQDGWRILYNDICDLLVQCKDLSVLDEVSRLALLAWYEKMEYRRGF